MRVRERCSICPSGYGWEQVLAPRWLLLQVKCYVTWVLPPFSFCLLPKSGLYCYLRWFYALAGSRCNARVICIVFKLLLDSETVLAWLFACILYYLLAIYCGFKQLSRFMLSFA